MMTELNIADVLRYYGATTVPEGTGWKAMKCPFHSDGVRSASINVDRNLFKCHGCPFAGDPIDLIKRKEQLNYGDAIEYATKVLGARIESVSRADDKPVKRRPLGRERWKGLLD